MPQEGPLLEVQGLTKSFGGLVAVHDLSFSVRAGQIVGMIGPNGAGKTTTFNLITGFYPPDRGRIRFAGEDLTGRRPFEICARGICRTFQVAKPFAGLTVLRNVMMGTFLRHPDPRAAEARAREILAFVRLGEKADAVARSLTTIDQRRLEAARALATDPQVLLLDETMAGLNPREIEEAIALLRRIREGGRTLIVVEHVMRVIMSLSDRIVVLDQGTKIAEGLPAEVAGDPRVIEAYLGEGYRHA